MTLCRSSFDGLIRQSLGMESVQGVHGGIGEGWEEGNGERTEWQTIVGKLVD